MVVSRKLYSLSSVSLFYYLFLFIFFTFIFLDDANAGRKHNPQGNLSPFQEVFEEMNSFEEKEKDEEVVEEDGEKEKEED
jgi:hypothetical protein